MTKNKLNAGEKIQVVESYLQGNMRWSEVLRKYNIAESTFREWVHKYKTFGADGFTRKKNHTAYSGETKKCAVEEYLSGKGSLITLYHTRVTFTRTGTANRIAVPATVL